MTQAWSEAPEYTPAVSPAPVAVTDPPRSQPTNAPANVSPGRSLSGIASWYRYVPGQAAAGPRLRAMLGDWRGALVTVNGLPVRLADWCQCHEGADERLIDLDSRTFALLAPLSRGLLLVEIAAGQS